MKRKSPVHRRRGRARGRPRRLRRRRRRRRARARRPPAPTATTGGRRQRPRPAATDAAGHDRRHRGDRRARPAPAAGGRRHRGQAAADAAAERIQPLLEPVTEIPVTEPLDARARRQGKKLYWLEGNIQSILPITGGFEAATKALGWDLTTITYDPSDPQGPNAAMQQAVDAGADFIAISGQPVTAIETALAAAKAADIPVFAMFGENEADPEKGIVAVVGGLNTHGRTTPRTSPTS